MEVKKKKTKINGTVVALSAIVLVTSQRYYVTQILYPHLKRNLRRA
jgi:hypothetical protein